jgi:FtsP/CotA-like multicopper oxidase with cupredoxin domain
VDTVSQAAFLPNTTFRYRFIAEPAGTFWYHAHTGEQYADGLRGPLIVRVCSPAAFVLGGRDGGWGDILPW